MPFGCIRPQPELQGVFYCPLLMAKDPAVLFYTSDFLTGTMTLSDEQTGKYIKLLCLQHQKFELTEKDMMNICKSYDEDIFNKFIKTDTGYYNERMRQEADKRKRYSESRSSNRKNHMMNICKSYEEHMENENEDVIVIKDKKKKRRKSDFKPPSVDEVKLYFKSKGFTEESGEKAFYYYHENNWHDSHGKKVISWKQKMHIWFKDENKIQSQQRRIIV